MKTKMTTLLFALTLGATSSFAQISRTDRYGHGQDSIKCLENISMYGEHLKTKNYKEAYGPWKEVFYKHPAASINMYADGPIILKELIKAETDATQKSAYITELLGTYDHHIKHLNDVNAFRKRPVTKASILATQIHDEIVYAKPKDAMKVHARLLEILNMDPENAGHQIMLDLMHYSSAIAKQVESHKEQTIKDYLQTTELAKKHLDDAKKANQAPLADMWEQVKNNLDAYFINSGAANCESLQAIYAPQVETNKENLEFLKQVVSIMAMLKCTDQEAYMAAAEYAHNIEPTSRSAAGCASRYLKRGDTAKALEFMDQAIELETDENEKAEYAYKTAAILYSVKQLSKAKSYANKAISLKADYGAPYILIAQMYASSPKWSEEPAMNKCTYFAAIDKLIRAKNVDPSVAEEANKLIGQYSQYTPKPEDLFFLGLKKGDSVPIGGWIGETTTIR